MPDIKLENLTKRWEGRSRQSQRPSRIGVSLVYWVRPAVARQLLYA